MLKKISFSVTFLLASFALISVIPVSYKTLLQERPCPSISIIPACYIVTFGYSFIILSLFKIKRVFFYIGWLPVFLLALSGTTMEVLGHTVCPKSNGQMPLCYYSLAVSITLFISYYYFYKKQTQTVI